MDDCVESYELVSHPVFHISHWLRLLLLIPGIGFLFYLIFGKVLYSRFHGNVKWVIIAYFGSLICQAFNSIAQIIYILININMVRNPCDVYINQTIFKYAYQVAVIIFSMPMVMSFVISIERWIAKFNAANYEKFRIIIGPVLVFIAILADALVVVYVFTEETFDERMVSFFHTPSTSFSKISTFYTILNVLNFANFFVNSGLLGITYYMTNTKKGHLAIRYQLENVAHTTAFCTIIGLLHTFCFGTYRVAILLTSDDGPSWFSPATLKLVRIAATIFVPTYILCIALASIKLYNWLKTKRMIRLDHVVPLRNGDVELGRNILPIPNPEAIPAFLR